VGHRLPGHPLPDLIPTFLPGKFGFKPPQAPGANPKTRKGSLGKIPSGAPGREGAAGGPPRGDKGGGHTIEKPPGGNSLWKNPGCQPVIRGTQGPENARRGPNYGWGRKNKGRGQQKTSYASSTQKTFPDPRKGQRLWWDSFKAINLRLMPTGPTQGLPPGESSGKAESVTAPHAGGKQGGAFGTLKKKIPFGTGLGQTKPLGVGDRGDFSWGAFYRQGAGGFRPGKTLDRGFPGRTLQIRKGFYPPAASGFPWMDFVLPREGLCRKDFRPFLVGGGTGAGGARRKEKRPGPPSGEGKLCHKELFYSRNTLGPIPSRRESQKEHRDKTGGDWILILLYIDYFLGL